MFRRVTPGIGSAAPVAATANGHLVAGPQQAERVLREGRDDPAALAALADDHAGPARRGAGPDHDLVADAGVGGQRVPAAGSGWTRQAPGAAWSAWRSQTPSPSRTPSTMPPSPTGT